MHEAQLHQDNCFLTLTYDDEHLPPGGSLDRSAFPAFIKRLRTSQRVKVARPDAPGKWRWFYPSIRYFHCGEYGDRYGRPHYHACVFGFDFEDKQLVAVRNQLPVWSSQLLRELWPFGVHEIGSVTFESAAYVARYIMKKVRGNGPEAEKKAARYLAVDGETGEVFSREPEYATMSRRPGIGAGWFAQFSSDVYPHDQLVARGSVMRPPRYYDKLLADQAPDVYAGVQLARALAEVDVGEQTGARLAAREAVTQARVNLRRRLVE